MASRPGVISLRRILKTLSPSLHHDNIMHQAAAREREDAEAGATCITCLQE